MEKQNTGKNKDKENEKFVELNKYIHIFHNIEISVLITSTTK